jgi:hypothetical protein
MPYLDDGLSVIHAQSQAFGLTAATRLELSSQAWKREDIADIAHPP